MMGPTKRIAGVLLAAGRGRRMGTLKQLLPWKHGTTIVESAFDAIAPFCNAGMIVVVGSAAEEISEALAPRTCHIVRSDSDAEMFASIMLGLERALTLEPTHILLHPADHPCAPPQVVEAIIERTQSCTAVPTHEGKGGHPACIPVHVIPHILAWTGSGGLREFWIEHPDLVDRIEFDDCPEITLDLDTPDDYRNAADRRSGP